MGMSKKRKTVVIVTMCLLLVIALVLVFLFGPMPMRVDWTKVHKVETNVVLLSDGCDGKPAELIKYNEDGSIDESPWKVLQFTDLHYGDKMKDNETTLYNMLDAIYEEKPDYVVMTGDIITSIRGRSRAVQLCNIFEKLGIYWTYLLGNHEGDQFLALSRKELIDICASYPHCVVDNSVKYTADGTEVWGYGNCVVNLLGKDKTVVQSMIFLDSGDAITDSDAERVGVKKGTYDFLKENQMQWYEEQVNASVALNASVKTMLFIHIPLIEQGNLIYVRQSEYEAQEDASNRAVLLSEQPNYLDTVSIDAKVREDAKKTVEEGKIASIKVGESKVAVYPAAYKKVAGSERVLDGKTIGFFILRDGWSYVEGTGCYEGCCSSDYNNGMYDLMKSLGDHVNGLFCGHDHVTNSVLFEDGAYTKESSPVYLCYGICGGYATYSLYTKKMSNDKDELKGYSIITIYADSSFDYYGVQYSDTSVKTPYIIGNLPAQGEA